MTDGVLSVWWNVPAQVGVSSVLDGADILSVEHDKNK